MMRSLHEIHEDACATLMTLEGMGGKVQGNRARRLVSGDAWDDQRIGLTAIEATLEAMGG